MPYQPFVIKPTRLARVFPKARLLVPARWLNSGRDSSCFCFITPLLSFAYFFKKCFLDLVIFPASLYVYHMHACHLRRPEEVSSPQKLDLWVVVSEPQCLNGLEHPLLLQRTSVQFFATSAISPAPKVFLFMFKTCPGILSSNTSPCHVWNSVPSASQDFFLSWLINVPKEGLAASFLSVLSLRWHSKGGVGLGTAGQTYVVLPTRHLIKLPCHVLPNSKAILRRNW